MLLDHYISSRSIKDFNLKLLKIDKTLDVYEISNNLESYLLNCNTKNKLHKKPIFEFNPSKSKIVKQYTTKGKTIQIGYDSDLVKKTIHPALAYLETIEKEKADTTFDIYIDNDYLCLFKDRKLIISVPKRDYHLVQGKFIFHLLNIIHEKKESDWIGTFHGSTISDGKNAILLVGKSGKGKSTLSALLALNDFELLADDVSPILSENCNIYHNPLAISIKKGAFDVLRPIVTNFDTIPSTIFNKSKGPLKYISCANPKKDSYPCKAIVMINYDKDVKLNLEKTSLKTLLETLIPDSWLSPNPIHVKQFLDWLENINLYQLNYGDSKSVIEKVSRLFEEFSNN